MKAKSKDKDHMKTPCGCRLRCHDADRCFCKKREWPACLSCKRDEVANESSR